eukprot:GHVH01004181.1.p1 GENE.GHVH01004181.1~~GHVH01004181.1.p1  ORF type:complete len:450 (+),score=17.10 GHVH01004181.1:94-1443(+)
MKPIDISGPTNMQCIIAKNEGVDDVNYTILHVSKNSQLKLLLFSLSAGILHICYWNAFIQMSMFLGDVFPPEYNPLSKWLPCSGIGGLAGNSLYFSQRDPVRKSSVWVSSILLILSGSLLYVTMYGYYHSFISSKLCTMLGAAALFMCEMSRGFLQCCNFGFIGNYKHVQLAQFLGVAISVGEGFSGCLHSIVCALLTRDTIGDADQSWNVITMIFQISAAVGLMYQMLFYWLYHCESSKEIQTIWLESRRNRFSMISRENIICIENGLKPQTRLSEFIQAIPGTRLIGCMIALNVALTLNLFPTVLPFGYPITQREVQILLAMNNWLDPFFRMTAFVIEKLHKGEPAPRWHYVWFVNIKNVIVWVLVIIPYFWPENPYIDSFWQYALIMALLTIGGGFGRTFGIYTYLGHINPETAEQSSAMVVLYLVIGFVIGQLTTGVYPIIKTRL